MYRLIFGLLWLQAVSLMPNEGTSDPSSEELLRKCYDKFGCFSTTGPWRNPITRPVSLFPFSPEQTKPQYCLYTRRSPLTCDKLLIEDPSSLYRSSYKRGGQVYFIAHGFLEHGERPWIQEMTAELLKRSSSNVIVIDWKGGSEPPYAQAVANIRLIGVMTAHLMNMMASADVGFRPEHVHVIGHSLGAHLAGYIGTAMQKTFNMRIGRITGLDPAEPHFADTDPIVRLDPSDAIFVDNIHTDTIGFIRWGLGMKSPVGHIDFYPNGGKDQPGCTDGIQGSVNREKGSFIDGMRRWLNCDHIRSYQFFIPTINEDLPTTAVECPSYAHYLNGSCFSCNSDGLDYPKCAPMGFNSVSAFAPPHTKMRKGAQDLMLKESPKRTFLSWYLITDESRPFYRMQYRVTVKVAPETRELGLFEIRLLGEKRDTGYMRLDYSSKYFEFGSSHTIVVAGPTVGAIRGAQLKWSHETSFINPLTWRFVAPSIKVDFVTVEALGYDNRLQYCYEKSMNSGVPVILTNCVTKPSI